MKDKNICIIPARGGSKRIPKKNIKPFMGKPIIYYSIDTAIKSGLFDEVMVSTDDMEIAEIAKSYGAKVPFLRSAKMSSDDAIINDVIDEVIVQYEIAGSNFDNLCCIYPCSPFITIEKLENSYQLLIEKSYDSILAIVKYNYPIQRAFRLSNDIISYLQPEFINFRSQDLKQKYHDAGQFFWAVSKVFKKNKNLVNKNCGGFIISELEVQDIDTEEDWKLAELKFRLFNDLTQ